MKIREEVAAFRACFLNPNGEVVLKAFERVCYANKTTAANSDIAMSVAEGRRQVWLHIQHMLTLTDDQVYDMTNQGTEDE